MLTVLPSDTVRELLREGKRGEAMEAYSQEGATGQDVNILSTANRIATDSGISLDEALAFMDQPPAPAPERVGRVLLFGICWFLGGVVLLFAYVELVLAGALDSVPYIAVGIALFLLPFVVLHLVSRATKARR